MSTHVYLSRCCSFPCLARGTTTRFYVCTNCHEATDRRRTTHDSAKDAITYYASLTKPKKSCYRSNLQFFYLIACSVVAGVLIAIAAS